MFRNTLLATTALVLGASLAFATTHGVAPRQMDKARSHFVSGHSVHGTAMAVLATKHQAGAVKNNHLVPGGGIYDNFSKSKNGQFVSWYGFRVENSAFSDYYSSHDWFKGSEVANNAVGFSGGGALKSMTFAGFAYSSSDEFKGEILSSSGGLPGAVVATTSSTTMSDNSLCCSSARTVKFPKHSSLASGNYFASVACANSPCDGGWAMEDTDFSGSTVDYFHYTEKETYNTYYSGGTQHYTASSPWHASTYYPTAGAVIVK